MSLNIFEIHQLAKDDKIVFKKHTVLRMHQRGITSDEVKKMLSICEVVEDYPDEYFLPGGLVLGYTEDNRPLHGVIVLDKESSLIFLITVYEPTLEKWKEGFKERRAKNEMSIM